MAKRRGVAFGKGVHSSCGGHSNLVSPSLPFWNFPHVPFIPPSPWSSFTHILIHSLFRHTFWGHLLFFKAFCRHLGASRSFWSCSASSLFLSDLTISQWDKWKAHARCLVMFHCKILDLVFPESNRVWPFYILRIFVDWLNEWNVEKWGWPFKGVSLGALQLCYYFCSHYKGLLSSIIGTAFRLTLLLMPHLLPKTKQTNFQKLMSRRCYGLENTLTHINSVSS